MTTPVKTNQPTQTQAYDENDHQIPSLLFAIPFPTPANHHKTTESSPPFLLYTFPRSVYEKPPVDPRTGKPGKEKLIKKAERIWQQEVREGEEIKRGEHKDAGTWKKFKGAAARTASSVIKYMPNSTIETLGRLPPKQKLGTVQIIYPANKDVSPTINVPRLTEFEMKESFTKMLQSAKKQAFKQSIISGCLLPVTAAIDFFLIIPIFAFEVNIAYFSLQTNGARKVKALTNSENQAAKKGKATNSNQDSDTPDNSSIFIFQQATPNTFSNTINYLYSQCSLIDGRKFPIVKGINLPNYQPNRNIVEGMISEFQACLPEQVTQRHLLNVDRAAEDLARTLRKAAKEYVKTLE
ncbi:uncharacterized protein MELLADRAFT_75366 [Melampsora larici-populina 98AG31]|uniref:Secreted protein n=1 Tax=Melampsora larici-populina (strain 98AG31 / pathotype 3-4-7) TaxID=747676 RepID=F4RWU4_MELLP|nr:uncharacterized protein MELLADRAFT_75366 [Melampsora larici-populina 98AG31]EGG03164.1 secreted protein [Melampsora larici-populina 98AG31]